MAQAGEILKMLFQVILEIIKLFVGFLIQAFGLVLDFARAVGEMIR
jgi:hypothetical protein